MWKFFFWYDSTDSEEIFWLHLVASGRNNFYSTYGILFASDVDPADATAALRSAFSAIPSDLRGNALSDFWSYPAYLFTMLAKKFLEVQRSDLERTVAKLSECHAGCASRAQASLTRV